MRAHRRVHYRKGSLLEYDGVYLAEGPWPAKAQWDAHRLARQRDASHYLDYGFTRPDVISRGAYLQNSRDVDDRPAGGSCRRKASRACCRLATAAGCRSGTGADAGHRPRDRINSAANDGAATGGVGGSSLAAAGATAVGGPAAAAAGQ